MGGKGAISVWNFAMTSALVMYLMRLAASSLFWDALFMMSASEAIHVARVSSSRLGMKSQLTPASVSTVPDFASMEAMAILPSMNWLRTSVPTSAMDSSGSTPYLNLRSYRNRAAFTAASLSIRATLVPSSL